jgi:flagellar biosynthesis protein FliQ
MTQDLVVTLGKETVWMVLLLGAPMLGFGMFVGIVIAILQSATQIQEMTLTFVPKIVAVLVALIFFFPWLMRLLLEFTERLYTNIPFYIK